MAIIGIDLGTSNSLIAHWKDDGPEIIPNVFGEHLTPSVVSVDDNGEILVGKIAKLRAITHPEKSASTFKRFMGTEKIYWLGKYSFSAEDLSSFVLKSLKADAEAYLGEEITEAVISVPAYFNDPQRKATEYAAKLAGLKVSRLISEPTAASLSYGMHLLDHEANFMVFDLGGGTFDVSIIELFEGIVEVKAVAGNTFLGGEDFTRLLTEHFIETQGLIDLDDQAKAIVFTHAEQCKCQMEKEPFGIIDYKTAGTIYSAKISREEFESLSTPLLMKIRETVSRALKDASILPSGLDDILLVGGAMRMSMIKSLISRTFGRLPNTQLNPDEAIALGATVQAALIKREKAIGEMILTDVCSFTLGVEVAEQSGRDEIISGYFLPIIERNNPIPISIVKSLSTIADNQEKINVRVYQGESRLVSNNLFLGNIEVRVPVRPRGEESIDVRFTYDINGILEVEVKVVSTGKVHTLIIEKEPGKHSKESIQARLKQLQDLKIHPRDKAENRLLMQRGERLYEEALGDLRRIIAQEMHLFELKLRAQDLAEIKKAASRFENFISSLEQSPGY